VTLHLWLMLAVFFAVMAILLYGYWRLSRWNCRVRDEALASLPRIWTTPARDDSVPIPCDIYPDGTLDYAGAFQAFINCHGRMPDLPAGVYRISRALVLIGGGGGTSSGPARGSAT
jgi:hypothetical protein